MDISTHVSLLTQKLKMDYGSKYKIQNSPSTDYLHHLGISKAFLDMTWKALIIKRNTWQIGLQHN